MKKSDKKGWYEVVSLEESKRLKKLRKKQIQQDIEQRAIEGLIKQLKNFDLTKGVQVVGTLKKKKNSSKTF